jgi:hypothetical protein
MQANFQAAGTKIPTQCAWNDQRLHKLHALVLHEARGDRRITRIQLHSQGLSWKINIDLSEDRLGCADDVAFPHQSIECLETQCLFRSFDKQSRWIAFNGRCGNGYSICSGHITIGNRLWIQPQKHRPIEDGLGRLGNGDKLVGSGVPKSNCEIKHQAS